MAIVVEHEKRREEILEKALDVFMEEGYEDVTFQKIADRCGITRTTLYIYFSNKNEIFLWSIKQLLTAMEQSINKIVANPENSAQMCLRQIFSILIDGIEGNTKLFHVLLTYLTQLEKSGVSANDRVKHRVIRLRHVLNQVLIRGIQNKEFKDLSVIAMNDLLYGLIESAIFRIAVLSVQDIQDTRNTINMAIDGFLAD